METAFSAAAQQVSAAAPTETAAPPETAAPEAVSAASPATSAPADALTLRPIGHLHTDFPTKFGIPRQGTLVDGLRSTLVFAPPYRDAAMLRGIEGFSHLWLVWQFSASEGWSPTVRPPRLGGNTRMGVFATRAPFRPNPIGLSCVRLVAVRQDAALGSVLELAGADLMDGTPILDVKPYLPHADCHPEATGGFALPLAEKALRVECPAALLAALPPEKRPALLAVLAQDPRPAYQNDPARVYGFGFAGCEVRFTVADGVLTVRSVTPKAYK